MEYIQTEQVERSVKALLAHLKREKTQSHSNILEVDQELPGSEAIYLSIALRKIPEKVKTKPIKIALKHPFRRPGIAQVALITKDPQRQYKDIIANQNITCVQKVIGVSKLREKYKPYEAKRLLCASYDLFLADDRILPLLPKLLGKEFFKKKRIPVAVDLSKPSKMSKELDTAISSTYIHMATGPCQTVKIGNAGQKPKEVIENVLLSLPDIVDAFPKKWKNIQSIHIKTNRSVALPIYLAILNHKKSDSN